MGNPAESGRQNFVELVAQNNAPEGDQLNKYRFGIDVTAATSTDIFNSDKLRPGLTTTVTVDVPVHGGKTERRGYDVYVPSGYDGKSRLPVMFIFHGVSGGDGKGLMEKETNMNAIADQKQFIVVYPWSKTHSPDPLGKIKIQDWNSPGAGLTEPQSGYDDVDYVKSILKDLPERVGVDKDAIYVTGFSSGGQFARHLRGRIPETFAGVATVHGTLLGTEARPDPGDLAADISIVSSHDDMLPAGGGRGLMTLPLGRVRDSEPKNQFRQAANDNLCKGLPSVTRMDNFIISEYSPAQCHGFTVKEYYIDGDWLSGKVGGIVGRGKVGPAQHAWDGTGGGGWPIVGEKNRRIETSQLIADELLKYRRSSGSFRFFEKIK